MGIIRGTKIKTSNGTFVCTGLWMGKRFDIVAYDFMKYHIEPQVTDVFTIESDIINEKIKTKQIFIL